MTDLAAELFMRGRALATDAHRAHITTVFWSRHEGLGSFYEDLPGLLDTFVESYIGRTGMVMKDGDLPPLPPTGETNPIKLIEDYRTWVDVNRAKVSSASEIQNLIDEILTLCNQTLYKLRQFT